MKNKQVLKKLILILVISVSIVFIAACNRKATLAITYENGVYGVITNKEVESITANETEYQLERVTDKKIHFNYESHNLDNEYSNSVKINDYIYPLTATKDDQNVFVKNVIVLSGIIIKDEKIVVVIQAGTNNFNTYDNFWLRNIKLSIDGTDIWSEEYTKDEYEGESFKFGSNELTSPYRTGYSDEMSLTFQIPDEFLTHWGIDLNLKDQKIETVTNGFAQSFDNPSYLEIESNLKSGLISESFHLNIKASKDIDFYVTMDQVVIPSDLYFDQNSWSPGTHKILIFATNECGFSRQIVEEVEFKNYERVIVDQIFDFYETGHNLIAPKGLQNIGVKKTFSNNMTSPFSKVAIQNFIVKVNESNDFVWEGTAPINRTLKLEVYNHKKETFETVSTNKVTESAEVIRLGFNYQNQSDWQKNSELTIRVVSENLNVNVIPDKYIYHITDTQYIVQKGNTGPGIIRDRAVKALNEMRDEVLRGYQNNLIYTMITGDMIQSIHESHEGEWNVFMDEFLSPILSPNHPLGVLTGNHDVGGTSDWYKDGANNFDEHLSYESYETHLGESKFNEYSWYQESFEDNRSHYDLININGEDYIFLYLGWGSDRFGVHVSSKDIAFGKRVLDENPNTKAILLVHEYLNNRGGRTATGNYLFENLVLKCPNILLVFCGHINGSTYRIDFIDDDEDGITDRQVLQSLTNFQEEENTNGASFIRRLALDFTNNQIGFDLYSPYYKDSDIIVNTHPDIVKRDRNFIYDFDFNNLNYGLITYGVK